MFELSNPAVPTAPALVVKPVGAGACDEEQHNRQHFEEFLRGRETVMDFDPDGAAPPKMSMDLFGGIGLDFEVETYSQQQQQQQQSRKPGTRP